MLKKKQMMNRVVKEDYEKGYAKGRDYARHERGRGMVDTVFDALFCDPRDPPMWEGAEKEDWKQGYKDEMRW